MRHSSQVRPAGALSQEQGRARTKRRMRGAVIGLGALAIALTASGCTANEAFFMDMPEPVTKEGVIMYDLWHGSWIAAWAVGIVTWALMLWAAFAYRRKRKDEVPAQTKYNLPIEILYTIVPLVMILGLFWFTARDQAEILAVSDNQDETVNVVGYRWNWGFNYLDQDAYSVGSPNDPALLVLRSEEHTSELQSH